MDRMQIVDQVLAHTPVGVRGPTRDPIERLSDNAELIARLRRCDVISKDDPTALANPENWRKYLVYVAAQRQLRKRKARKHG